MLSKMNSLNKIFNFRSTMISKEVTQLMTDLSSKHVSKIKESCTVLLMYYSSFVLTLQM